MERNQSSTARCAKNLLIQQRKIKTPNHHVVCKKAVLCWKVLQCYNGSRAFEIFLMNTLAETLIENTEIVKAY